MTVKLHIPIIEPLEAPCCRRARWVRKMSLRLSFFNIAFSLGIFLAYLFLSKRVPSWMIYASWAVTSLVILTTFTDHFIGKHLAFLPETPMEPFTNGKTKENPPD